MPEVFVPSSFCVWNQMSWRNLGTRALPRGFLHEFLTKAQIVTIPRIIEVKLLDYKIIAMFF